MAQQMVEQQTFPLPTDEMLGKQKEVERRLGRSLTAAAETWAHNEWSNRASQMRGEGDTAWAIAIAMTFARDLYLVLRDRYEIRSTAPALTREDGEESDEDVAAQVANIVPSAAAMRVSRLMFEANEEAVCEVFGKPRRPADLSSRPLIGAKMIQLAIDEAVAEAMKSFSPSPIPATI